MKLILPETDNDDFKIIQCCSPVCEDDPLTKIAEPSDDWETQ